MSGIRVRKLLSFGILVACNAVLVALLGLRFASMVDGLSAPAVVGYVSLLVLGHMPLLVLPGAAIIALGILAWPTDIWIKWIAPAAFGIGLMLLMVDSVMLSQLRFHLNGMVWDFLFSGNAAKMLQFEPVTWLVAIGAIGAMAVVLLFEFWLGGWALRQGRRLGVASWVSLLVVAPALAIGAHLVHGFSEAMYRNDIVRAARFFPLYFPLSMSETLYRAGLVDRYSTRRDEAPTTEGTVALNYPRVPLQVNAPKKRPNILLIAIDSWRADALNQVTMPRLSDAASEFHRFERHRSGSNGTAGGIFSLFYGLPGTLWDDTISERRGPVLIKTLHQLNYSLGIFASAPITSPSFDKNVFVDVPEVRKATMLGEKRLSGYRADNRAVEEWFDFLESNRGSDDEQPFFGFLFLDATHNYSHPPEHRVFKPAWDEPQFLRLTNESDPTPMQNLYKNAVHFVDAKIGELIDDLKRRKLWENSIVIIVGDHGQEFNDFKQNYWGDESNFGEFQLHTPLLVHWPGRAPQVHHYDTSHYDIAPTLLRDALGVVNPASDFSFGDSLFVSHPTSWFLAADSDNVAILESDRISVKSSTEEYKIFSPTLETLEVPLRPEVFSKALERVNRFYR